jgi:type II secretory pathway pseudopilin PulG
MGRRTRGSRGYTVIEVMVGISLLMVMSAGVISLQKLTTFGNMRAKQLAVASQIGRSWIERLRVDAAGWNYPSPTKSLPSNLAGNTLWLNQIINQNGLWFEPAVVAGRGSPGADALGNDVQTLANANYCTHVRLSWMYPNEVMRADVRVFWQREEGLGTFNGTPLCGNPAAGYIANFDNPAMTPLARYHFAYFSSSIVKNTAP